MLSVMFSKIMHHGNVSDMKNFLGKHKFEEHMFHTYLTFIADLYTEYSEGESLGQIEEP